VLTRNGERRPQQQDVKWHRRERAYGTFARTSRLPFRVDPDRVQARYEDGILESNWSASRRIDRKKFRSASRER
jgi:HSP20 family protein